MPLLGLKPTTPIREREREREKSRDFLSLAQWYCGGPIHSKSFINNFLEGNM
jgi:hypothetical protein